LPKQAQIHLVDERGALQRVLAALTAQVMPGEPVQLAIDEGDEGVEGFGVAVSPPDQKFRDPF
jgi:hypothetical protein